MLKYNYHQVDRANVVATPGMKKNALSHTNLVSHYLGAVKGPDIGEQQMQVLVGE